MYIHVSLGTTPFPFAQFYSGSTGHYIWKGLARFIMLYGRSHCFTQDSRLMHAHMPASAYDCVNTATRAGYYNYRIEGMGSSSSTK